jgi:hypothetical protein
MVTRTNTKNANMVGKNPSVKSVVDPVYANMGIKNPGVKSVVDPKSANMGVKKTGVKNVEEAVSVNMIWINTHVLPVLPRMRVQPVGTNLCQNLPGFIPNVPGVIMLRTRMRK